MKNQKLIDLNGSAFDIARWIWKNLVPESGQSLSVQGELLRSIEKLRWEAQENGNINWDDRFVMFINFLEDILCSESGFSQEAKESIKSDLNRLRNFIFPDEISNRAQAASLPYIEDDLYDRLTYHVIEFCKLHPEVIARDHDPEQYR